MREQVLVNGLTTTNPSSTGELVSTSHTIDYEENAMVDDQIDCTLIVTIISGTYTSGGTEGILFSLRNDDATTLATARDAAGAGYRDAGTIDLLITDIFDVSGGSAYPGKQFSCHCKLDKAKRYSGCWVRAKSTQLTGTIVFDAEVHYGQVTMNEDIQVKRTSI